MDKIENKMHEIYKIGDNKDDRLNFVGSKRRFVRRDEMGYIQHQSTGLSTKNFGSTGSLHRLVERIKDTKAQDGPSSRLDVMISDQ